MHECLWHVSHREEIWLPSPQKTLSIVNFPSFLLSLGTFWREFTAGCKRLGVCYWLLHVIQSKNKVWNVKCWLSQVVLMSRHWALSCTTGSRTEWAEGLTTKQWHCQLGTEAGYHWKYFNTSNSISILKWYSLSPIIFFVKRKHISLYNQVNYLYNILYTPLALELESDHDEVIASIKRIQGLEAFHIFWCLQRDNDSGSGAMLICIIFQYSALVGVGHSLNW